MRMECFPWRRARQLGAAAASSVPPEAPATGPSFPPISKPERPDARGPRVSPAEDGSQTFAVAGTGTGAGETAVMWAVAVPLAVPNS